MISLLVTVQFAASILTNTEVFTTETVPIEPGTYSVSVNYSEGNRNVDTVIKTTIGTNNFVTVNNIAIDANDIYVVSDQVLDSDFLLLESKVKAWDVNTNETYAIEKIDVVELDETTFEVTFSTINNVSTKIAVYVVSKNELYEPYIQDEEENIIQYYTSEKYGSLWFLTGLFALIIIIFILHIKIQNDVRKQFNELTKI